ncbi:MAPEG family protein [Brevirhabdus sp.]|uniref:MAPEG family protein n=1 Tax=Brevirhabdus sp. TaxID=2004514 RepID=UPI00405A3F3E
MPSELSILVLYGLWVMLVILMPVLMAMPQLGLGYLVSPRDEQRRLHGRAARMERALANSVVAMALFAPAVLIVFVSASSSTGTLIAANLFLLARVAYVAVYVAGIAWLRTLLWVTGLLCTAYIYIAAL